MAKLSKNDAVYAMLHDGAKISHESFTSKEWMKYSNGYYEFEDGNLCEPSEFWSYRSDDGWKSGWSIVK